MSRSKYFLLNCVFFIFGIALGSFFSIQAWILFLIVGFSISLIFLLKDGKLFFNDEHLEDSSKNKEFFVISLIFIISFSFGFIRMETNKFSVNEITLIESLDGQKISLKGKILQSPEIKNGKQKLVLKDIKSEKNITGKIIVYTERYPEYNMGDEIALEGKLNIPEDFDGFEYQNYLFSKGIFYIVYYPQTEIINKNSTGIIFQISKFRKSADNVIKKIFPEPEAGIISAMTIGIKSSISSDVLDDFNKTGTRHLIAISGLHMSILIVLLMYFLISFGLKRNYAFYFSILGILFFVTLIGFPSSAVRASLMSGLVLFAIKSGRLSNIGNSIIFAGTVMLLFNPNLLRYDTGFQLSFLAVLGIVYIYPSLDFYLKKYRDYLKIKTIFLITISAQIATLPIIIHSFGSYSLSSVFANILVLPFVPIVMIGGIVSVMMGFVSLSIGQIIAIPILLILSFQIYVIKFFAGFNIGYFSFENVSFLFYFIYYVVLIFVLLVYNKKNVNCISR